LSCRAPALILQQIHNVKLNPAMIYAVLIGGLGNTSFIGLPMIEAFYGANGMPTGILIDQAVCRIEPRSRRFGWGRPIFEVRPERESPMKPPNRLKKPSRLNYLGCWSRNVWSIEWPHALIGTAI
jgi:hypothetical protein